MILDDIVERRKEQLEKEKKKLSFERIKLLAEQEDRPVLDFYNALNKNHIGIIAEVKKASPSKGIISYDFNYKTIAKSYEEAGASAISVLTEEYYFKGSSKYLKEIREIVKLPLLRKDFIIEPYQIYEARVMGADAILLIAALLDKDRLQEFLEIAKSLGLHCLVEVHNEEELEKVIDCKASIVGINNRNLRTFEVSLETTRKLARQVPKDRLIISESGIASDEDIHFLKDCGVQAVLIGESLMKSADVKETLTRLKEEADR